jgi:hypothetical protein
MSRDVMRWRVNRRELAAAGAIALVFSAAPTVGDVGACGRRATDLNMELFASARKTTDCRRCADCGLTTRTCMTACDPHAPGTAGWPSTCHPLSEDGDVCVRALQAASCSDYASFVDDAAPTAPGECDFCHLAAPSGAPPGDL